MKDSALILKPGVHVMYSPTSSLDNEYPAVILETEPQWIALHEWLIEWKCPVSDQVLVFQSYVWEGRLRIGDRGRAEQLIREGLSGMAREAIGLEVPEEAWGTQAEGGGK